MNDAPRHNKIPYYLQFEEWLSRFTPDKDSRYPYFVLTCMLMGLGIGLSTHILETLLDYITKITTTGLNPHKVNLQYLILPTIGILITVAYTSYAVRIPLNHGCERVATYLRDKDYNLTPRLMWSPVIASSITLGFGGSAGAEGPSAFTGAAIASNIGRKLHLNQEHMRLIVGIGAGAGIAGIFRSPIGGVIFTLEVLQMPLSTLNVIALIVSCLCAGELSYLLAGSHFHTIFHGTIYPTEKDIIFIILLGIICGLYSLYYTYITKHIGKRLEGINNRWIRGLASGIIVGACIFIFPPLFSTGYGPLNDLLHENYNIIKEYGAFAGEFSSPQLLLLLTAGIVLLKGVATASTNYGGGVAGVFAPTLVAGGYIGFIVASGCNMLLGTTLHVSSFVFLGMAGAMAGIINAPLMAIFLTAEMANQANYLWALALTAIVSWVIRQTVSNKVWKR